MSKLSKTKFLCVDDEPNIRSTCDRLESTLLKIDVRKPVASWTKELSEIHSIVTKQTFGGLLIDFRLDELHNGSQTKDAAGEAVCYTAEALVTELRRRSVERGRDESYPIVLWSTAKNLEHFYDLNPAYSRAYDVIWDKSSISSNSRDCGNLLLSLVNGYNSLHSKGKTRLGIKEILHTKETSILNDAEQYLRPRASASPYAFHYSLFLLHDFLNITGPLINAAVLFAYLGCEPLTQKENAKLISMLGNDIQYSGVFSDSHERYWRMTVLQRLEHLFGVSPWLSLRAEDRIALLTKELKGVSWKTAHPLDNTYATDYDCICIITQKPLSKRNGFRLFDRRQLPWREADYVAGVSYRKNYSHLKKTRPLESEDKDRFSSQFEISL